MRATTIKNRIAFAKSLISPMNPYYATTTALYIITAVVPDHRVVKDSLAKRHIVTLLTAKKLIQDDYHKHPSKKREYQLTDLQAMINNGQNNCITYGYVADRNSSHKRMACEPLDYGDVMGVIDDIDTAYPQLRPAKHVFKQWDKESRQRSAKVAHVATPF